MVLAEVPLWVVHPGSKIDGTLKAGQAASSEKNGNNAHLKERAQKSLSLLETGGGGKCAIYSVDINPQGTRFATGGGDCTVRIWNASSLFAKQGGHFGESGKYESSDSSDAGPSSSEDNGTEESSVDGQSEQDVVHDLNSVVRRKKDGSTPTKPVAEKPTAFDSPSKASPSKLTRSSSHHHRLLSTLSAHTGSSVLAVRFSTSGHYLASAGDDAVVCIYAPSKSSAASGNLTENSVEHWSRIKLCRGHTLDVVGLAWAPDDSHLVSCSLDSDAPIIVWKLTDLASAEESRPTKANVLCNPYKILGKNVHSSTVKGVTFDPAGTYLASSGDDPAVCIWRAHDDWGLERRVDASSGIFRSWKQGQEDLRELSSQTLFRRLDWSTDGSYICSTNATIKNKHVASTISREGWGVSSANSVASGAANLVGHKQPVVVCRHSRQLLDARKSTDMEQDDDLDDEPEYATLLALGDKRGFVTVWSTRKSRPLFKLQCSESRCTVTDLTWGKVRNGNDLVLLVSLLDGHIVALRFGVTNELGTILSDKDQSRVFQLRYGIDLDDEYGLGRRRLFVGDSSGPKLIENALQMTLEEQENESGDEDVSENGAAFHSDDDRNGGHVPSPKVKINQVESRSKATGKKRIRPVLMSVNGEEEAVKRTKESQNGTSNNGDKIRKEKKKSDPMKDALDSASKAASAAEDINTMSSRRDGQKSRLEADGAVDGDHSVGQAKVASHEHRSISVSSGAHLGAAHLPHSTNRIHSIELPLLPVETFESDVSDNSSATVADCTNSNRVPTGSSGQSVPCATLSISRGGRKQWHDEIIGTSCSAIAAATRMLAVGTADGCVYLYGASPTVGWASGVGFRSHPPLVIGNAIVALQLTEQKDPQTEAPDGAASLKMLVVSSDGAFGVYSLMTDCSLIFKGSILPAMTHMALASSNESFLPRLARMQVTESDQLLLILSLQSHQTRSISDDHSTRSGSRTAGTMSSVGVGGSLQAFVYNRSMELWMRVSDSRFILSDFYSMLPTTKSGGGVHGVLSRVDDAVRSGSTLSSLKPSHRGRQVSDGYASAMYHHAEDGSGSQASNIVTRSHCEDRMACALALGSAQEFEHWLTMFVRILSMSGNANHLRLVVDMLLGTIAPSGDVAVETTGTSSCWWLSSASTVLNLTRKDLVRKIVITEMSKNRALQRLTNEIALEIDSLS